MAITLLKKISGDDASTKCIWKCGSEITETSALILEHREPSKTICVPTQFGCPVRCTFCASKDFPYKKNIDSAEMIGLIESTLKTAKIRENFQVSFMGQGEPFFNLKNLKLTYVYLKRKHPKIQFGISTIGIPHLLQQLLDNHQEIVKETRFQISLHSAIESKRRMLIPYSASYPMQDLYKKVTILAKKSKRKICMNYLLLDGINDAEEDIKQLAGLDPELFYIKLSVYNQMENDMLKPSPKERFDYFKNQLEQFGFEVACFQSIGVKVNAGCGQLCRKYYQ